MLAMCQQRKPCCQFVDEVTRRRSTQCRYIEWVHRQLMSVSPRCTPECVQEVTCGPSRTACTWSSPHGRYSCISHKTVQCLSCISYIMTSFQQEDSRSWFWWSNDGVMECFICISYIMTLLLPSVLWRCWLGGRKGIRPVENKMVGCCCGSVWSEVQTCI